ncbi:uncharacterized protein [Clytia hemisphaerica]|uniref:uncharacterized protein isoform X2 n=1 Tax=Clytia hemisphaerica TaxID=252671 RepID=UPI0034D42471
MQKINASKIINKWSTHNSGNVNAIEFESAPALDEIGTEFSRINRRRNIASHRGQKRDKNALLVEEAVQKSKKFSLVLPVLKNPSKEYTIYSCKSCSNLLEFTDAPVTQSSTKTINLLDHITRKTRKSYLHWIAPTLVFMSKEKQRFNGRDEVSKPSFIHCFFTWHTMKNLASYFNAICVQRSDQLSLRAARKKEHPVVFVHSEESFFGSVLLHIYLACVDTQIPTTVLKGDCVKSSLVRYFMRKMGFLFMGNEKESESSIKDVVEVFSSEDGSFTLKTLIFSLWRSVSNFGLLHINVSRCVKLKSLVRAAKDLNQQEEVHEENNLISRHLNFDMLETQNILPVHIVSCLLCTKYRLTKGVSLEDLSKDVEAWTEKLKEMSKNIGFCGEPIDITSHAIQLLHQQDLITVHEVDNKIKPKLSTIKQASLFYQHSLKMVHTFMTRAVLACTIISECGGEKILRFPSTHQITFIGSKILEKAEFLSEMVSFLLDYHCPFNQISDSLTSTMDHFVAMGYIKMQETGFMDNYHQRLARCAQINSALGEEDFDGRNNEIIYELVMHEDLLTYHQFLQPFVQLSFTVLALIKEQFSDELFQVSGIYTKVEERYNTGFFKYGEMVHMEFVSRFCDYLFEMEVVDDEKDWYKLSQDYRTNDELLLYLQRIAKFRA